MHGSLMDIIVQLIAGAAGGTAAGAALKDLSLGKPGDAISGAIGGGVVGQILAAVMGAAAAGGGDVGGMDVVSVVRDIVGSGVGGAVVMAVIGFLRNAMMKK